MNSEERDIISKFVARVGGAPVQPAFGQSSVPATQSPPLPPVDVEANGLIQQMFQRYPEASYRMTQLAYVQEQGLIGAQNRIQQLEAQMTQMQQALQQAQQQAQQTSKPSGGFLGGLFGGSRQQAAPPPQQGPWGGQPGRPGGGYQQQPQYAPQQFAPAPQAAMMQGGGSGFLGSALRTAAGVAGGVVAGNLLMNMISGGHGGLGGLGGAGSGAAGLSGANPAIGATEDQAAWNTGTPDSGSGLGQPAAGAWDSGGGVDPNAGAGWDSGGSVDPTTTPPDNGWDSGANNTSPGWSGGGGGDWDGGGGGGGGSDDTF